MWSLAVTFGGNWWYFSVDLQAIPSPKIKAVNVWAIDYAQFRQEIKEHIEKMNA